MKSSRSAWLATEKKKQNGNIIENKIYSPVMLKANRRLWGRGKHLRFVFQAASKQHTHALGMAFAPVIRAMAQASARDARVYRIGLEAEPSTGKSTLVRGMLASFEDRKILEFLRDGYDEDYHFSGLGRDQSLRAVSDPQAGTFHLRHYDTRIWKSLGSYAKNNGDDYLPLVDVVEHPRHDMHNKRFDCIIGLNRPISVAALWRQINPGLVVNDSAPRNIGFQATPALAATPAFQDFVEKAREITAATPASGREAAAACRL